VSPKLKKLSGAEVVAVFKIFGFVVHSQRGSHVKLRRLVITEKQTLTIPLHSELDTGTLRSIIRQSARYISESDLHPYFYSE
jgi:predicted RNA binding protein YcfA (HicA-like mRNA interferase family)